MYLPAGVIAAAAAAAAAVEIRIADAADELMIVEDRSSFRCPRTAAVAAIEMGVEDDAAAASVGGTALNRVRLRCTRRQ